MLVTLLEFGMVMDTFEGPEDGVAFELYWAEFNPDDIQDVPKVQRPKHG